MHTHVVVANLTPDADGRWSALYGKLVYRWAKTLGYLYQAELRAALTDTLGFAWGPVLNGMSDVDGIPAFALEEFSTRRAQITDAMHQAGTTSPAAAQTATLATRAAKSTVPDLATLKADWAARAHDLQPRARTGRRDHPPGQEGRARPRHADHRPPQLNRIDRQHLQLRPPRRPAGGRPPSHSPTPLLQSFQSRGSALGGWTCRRGH
jgi:hypothetical protein